MEQGKIKTTKEKESLMESMTIRLFRFTERDVTTTLPMNGVVLFSTACINLYKNPLSLFLEKKDNVHWHSQPLSVCTCFSSVP